MYQGPVWCDKRQGSLEGPSWWDMTFHDMHASLICPWLTSAEPVAAVLADRLQWDTSPETPLEYRCWCLIRESCGYTVRITGEDVCTPMPHLGPYNPFTWSLPPPLMSPSSPSSPIMQPLHSLMICQQFLPMLLCWLCHSGQLDT